jgi:glycosyltransferase involved in cell wall biosynthesis
MKEKIKFSICIPNYNYADYIGITIQSVLNQSYSNFEIIVADNASEDSSIFVVESFKDDRIIIRSNKYNIGFSPNLNKATLGATGDYMILLSSDDIMNPGALEEYARVIHNYNGNENDLVIMSGCDIIDSHGKVFGQKRAMTGDVIKFLEHEGVNVKEYEESNYEGLYILKALLSGRFQPAGQFLTTCFSNKLFQKVEGYNSILSIWPDAHFSHKILFENPIVIYLNKNLFGYRVHEQNNLAATENLSNIKALVDGYHLTLLYPDKILNKAGFNKSQLKKKFIKNICLLPAIYALLRGNFKKPFHHLMFAFGSYPLITIGIWQSYIILLLLPIVPIFKILTLVRKLIK